MSGKKNARKIAARVRKAAKGGVAGPSMSGIPALAPNILEKESRARSASPAGVKRTRVLICDDDLVYSRMISDMLETMGYEWEWARDPSALAASVAEFVPDVFVLDMHMPNGGGPAAVKQLRADPRTALIPIIISSSMPVADQMSRFQDQALIDFLPKPPAPARLAAIVLDLTEQARRAKETGRAPAARPAPPPEVPLARAEEPAKPPRRIGSGVFAACAVLFAVLAVAATAYAWRLSRRVERPSKTNDFDLSAVPGGSASASRRNAPAPAAAAAPPSAAPASATGLAMVVAEPMPAAPPPPSDPVQAKAALAAPAPPAAEVKAAGRSPKPFSPPKLRPGRGFTTLGGASASSRQNGGPGVAELLKSLPAGAVDKADAKKILEPR